MEFVGLLAPIAFVFALSAIAQANRRTYHLFSSIFTAKLSLQFQLFKSGIYPLGYASVAEAPRSVQAKLNSIILIYPC